MEIINIYKVKKLNEKRKHRIAERLRTPLERLAHNKGGIGRAAARLDSFISRHIEDKGSGIYT